jgi:hypothetical protein
MASFSRKEGCSIAYFLKKTGCFIAFFFRKKGSGVCMEILAYTAYTHNTQHTHTPTHTHTHTTLYTECRYAVSTSPSSSTSSSTSPRANPTLKFYDIPGRASVSCIDAWTHNALHSLTRQQPCIEIELRLKPCMERKRERRAEHIKHA